MHQNAGPGCCWGRICLILSSMLRGQSSGAVLYNEHTQKRLRESSGPPTAGPCQFPKLVEGSPSLALKRQSHCPSTFKTHLPTIRASNNDGWFSLFSSFKKHYSSSDSHVYPCSCGSEASRSRSELFLPLFSGLLSAANVRVNLSIVTVDWRPRHDHLLCKCFVLLSIFARFSIPSRLNQL